MFPKRTWQNLVFIFLYTFLIGCVYQVLTFRQELSNSADQILSKVEFQLSKIERELRTVYQPIDCSIEAQKVLAHHVFRSLGLRGLAVGKVQDGDEQTFIGCSNFGQHKAAVSSQFWDARYARDVAFAKIKQVEYRRDPSFALALIKEDTIVLGAINPRIILGWWIEPFFPDTKAVLSFSDGTPLLSRGIEIADEDGFEMTTYSEKFPVMVRVVQPETVLLDKLITFVKRLLFGGMLIFGSLMLIDVYHCRTRSAVLVRAATYTLRMLLAFGLIWWLFTVVKRALRPVAQHRAQSTM